MRRLGVPVVMLLLLILFSGAVWGLFAYLDLPQVVATAPSDKARTPSDQTPSARKQPEVQRAEGSLETSGATFDVARIDPQGTSVFAGRAKPGDSVTIMADGEPIGTTEADENGEWTFSVEHRFANDDPKLALRAGPPPPKREPEVARAETTTTTQAPVAPEPGKRGSAAAVTTKLLKNLEGMVETARNETARSEAARSETPRNAAPPSEAPRSEGARSEPVREPAPVPPAALPESKPERGTVTAARVVPPPAPPVEDAPARAKSVPVPITFVFNEANFTENGRKAAALLLEYLKLKRFPSVRLTGHADERGTEEFNMELSRERLDTVAKFLRENGYDGHLELIPKGKSEPFTGVVRSEYDQEELWQLDRRVELLVTQ